MRENSGCSGRNQASEKAQAFAEKNQILNAENHRFWGEDFTHLKWSKTSKIPLKNRHFLRLAALRFQERNFNKISAISQRGNARFESKKTLPKQAIFSPLLHVTNRLVSHLQIQQT